MANIQLRELDLHSKPMALQMGPSHPAMHGTVRLLLELDGETVVHSEVNVGYLHRGFEKECEQRSWNQAFPFVDRLNYVSPTLNSVGYALAVEKMLDLTIPERAQYIRVIMGELGRIADHYTLIAAMALELGAFTPFLWAMQVRELIYRLWERCSGARVTLNYCRIGGVSRDLPRDFAKSYEEIKKVGMRLLHDCDVVLTRNRIFMDRMEGVAVISGEEAKSYGFTGPSLRSTGVDYDVRKDHPYLVYDRFDFDVPVGTRGDNYDRYLVRLEEIYQSFKIIDQALSQLPVGPIIVDDWRVALPPKDQVYTTIEGCIAHFKLIMEGTRVPPGEVYSYTEAANGELGFFLVSNGSGKPYRMHVRAPCFAMMQGMSRLIQGHLIADIIPTFDSINMIGGECDR